MQVAIHQPSRTNTPTQSSETPMCTKTMRLRIATPPGYREQYGRECGAPYGEADMAGTGVQYGRDYRPARVDSVQYPVSVTACDMACKQAAQLA